MEIIEPRTGTAFILKKGQLLKVTDIQGEQVSDFVCFNLMIKGNIYRAAEQWIMLKLFFLQKGIRFIPTEATLCSP